MDAMKFLLGATAALLFGAIFVSWQGMQRGVKNASPEEISQLREEIAELKEEYRKSRPAAPQPAPQPLPQPQYTPEQIAEAQRIIDQQNAADAAKVAAANQAKIDAQLKIDEEGLIQQKILESQDDELRRSRLIAEALLAGRITDYVDDPQYGGFITFDVLMPEQVQVGSILGIRRNKTGILSRFKVSNVSPDGAIANPETAIGPIKPQKGDELIFPPQF